VAHSEVLTDRGGGLWDRADVHGAGVLQSVSVVYSVLGEVTFVSSCSFSPARLDLMLDMLSPGLGLYPPSVSLFDCLSVVPTFEICFLAYHLTFSTCTQTMCAWEFTTCWC
jgi:hypothetical protein